MQFLTLTITTLSFFVFICLLNKKGSKGVYTFFVGKEVLFSLNFSVDEVERQFEVRNFRGEGFDVNRHRQRQLIRL